MDRFFQKAFGVHSGSLFSAKLYFSHIFLQKFRQNGTKYYIFSAKSYKIYSNKVYKGKNYGIQQPYIYLCLSATFSVGLLYNFIPCKKWRIIYRKSDLLYRRRPATAVLSAVISFDDCGKLQHWTFFIIRRRSCDPENTSYWRTVFRLYVAFSV